MKNKDLLQQWLNEEKLAKRFTGWDFSHLNNRWYNERLPWNYSEIVKQHLKSTDQLLDTGTGDAELLLSFGHPYDHTAVTETWQPNIDLLKKKLAPLGVQLYASRQENYMPNVSNNFDMITNSHDGLNFVSIVHCLKPDGLFITEQVGATNNYSLSSFLSDKYVPAYPQNTLVEVVSKFVEHGFQIMQSDVAYPKIRFYDVGALVYYATIISWEFPAFSVLKCQTQLKQLQNIIDQTGFIESNEDRFLLVAKKQ
ncbi:methyltransferase domain-containing protein [Oenococcus oeni]|uniref:SAM-dependent methyltransferase n=1 Tax=Oenococcus oeni TaxID=1247 RepID=UPI0010B91DB2|nr:SAM-dependent methyltransferase [Oenococcus oeni]SYW13959.1 SAM-dependent methyltransferase [Oenococcus oeni]